jgi:uncharacterized protein (TIGR02678 family)
MSISGMVEQRQMALQDLMDRYLIARDEEPEAYRRIALHEPWLKAWVMERPQWRILSGRGVYRLERLPSQVMSGRGLPRLRSRMAYACLCWVLWFAETMATGARDWFVISELAERIAVAAEGRFNLGERSHREALVQALHLLTDLGGMVLRDGDTDRWVAGQGAVGEEVEVMYEFADNAPRLLANFAYDGLTALSVGEVDGSTALPTGEVAAPLARAWRALLLGPVLWQGDDPEAFAALELRHQVVAQELETALGWGLQWNPQYASIWRLTTARHAGGLLLDLYPDSDQPAEDRHIRYRFHPVLLLLDRCREQVDAGRWRPDRAGAVPVPVGELHDLISDLRSEHRKSWGSELGALGATELVDLVLREMRRMGLLRGPDHRQRCYLLPTAGRIRGQYVASRNDVAVKAKEEERPVQSSLF